VDQQEELLIRVTPEHGVHVPHLTERIVHSIEEFQSYLEITNRNSLIEHTRMGTSRARYSYLCRVILENVPQKSNPALPTMVQFAYPPGELSEEEWQDLHSLLKLLGCERLGRSDSSLSRSRIGSSLNAFSCVICALNDSKPRRHIPFRASKLTLLLAETLKFGMTAGIYCVDVNSSL
jgi:hypothetical protein